MFAMICTDNLRYKRTKYYDSEYIIKGTLHINEHAYAFSHYEGAFEVLGIRWLSNYTKGRYSKDTGLEFSIGADTEEGRLLQEHKDEAIECILQTVHAYKLTNLDAWVEYFNFAVSCTGTYQYSVTRCQAFPDERFRCTIKTPSPDCVLTYSKWYLTIMYSQKTDRHCTKYMTTYCFVCASLLLQPTRVALD